MYAPEDSTIHYSLGMDGMEGWMDGMEGMDMTVYHMDTVTICCTSCVKWWPKIGPNNKNMLYMPTSSLKFHIK